MTNKTKKPNVLVVYECNNALKDFIKHFGKDIEVKKKIRAGRMSDLQEKISEEGIDLAVAAHCAEYEDYELYAITTKLSKKLKKTIALTYETDYIPCGGKHHYDVPISEFISKWKNYQKK